MDSPDEELDFTPTMEICTHEVGTRLTLGVGPDGSKAVLTFIGHDEHGSEIAVSAHMPGCVLDQLSVRLQEYQMAASMPGISDRVSPGMWRRLRAAVLEPRNGGDNGHGH